MIYVYLLQDGTYTPVTTTPRPQGARVVRITLAEYRRQKAQSESQ